MQLPPQPSARPAKTRSARSTPLKPKTKKEQLIALLRAKGGADVTHLATTLGWLPHTVRAALTGLRRSGLTVERLPQDGDKPTRYRIAAK